MFHKIFSLFVLLGLFSLLPGVAGTLAQSPQPSQLTRPSPSAPWQHSPAGDWVG